MDLNIVNSGPSGAVIRATLTALDGKLRIGVEANLSPVMDVEALTSAIGAPPAIVQLSLIDVQLHVGSLGQLDVLAIADAVHEAAQQSAKLIQSLKAFFGELIDDIGDQFEKAIAAITLSPAPAASTPQPQPSAPSSPSPSQRVAIALGVAAARANVVMRLVLRRFLLLLPVTEIRWRGGSSLIVDAHVTVPAVQLVASGSALPTPTTTPWPVAADATFAPLVETLLPGVGPNAMSTLGTSVRVEMLERFELEFESAQWAPWAALTATPVAWKGAAPSALLDPTLTLEAAPPLPLAELESGTAPVFYGKYVPSGPHGRLTLVFEPWQLEYALEQAVAALVKPDLSGEHVQLLQALIAAASTDGKHRTARVVASAMPHQTLAFITHRIVWLHGKKKGATAMAALPLKVDHLVPELKAFSSAIGTIWKLPSKLSLSEQQRRRQLLVPVVAGADAEVQAQWLRAVWAQVAWEPGVGYPGTDTGWGTKQSPLDSSQVRVKDPFGGKGPKWRPNG